MKYRSKIWQTIDICKRQGGAITSELAKRR